MAEQEQKYYTSIFTKTDTAGTGKIDGKQAVALFRTSGVQVQILKQIWSLATPNMEDHLDKNRFFVALKLIALAQAGKSVSIQLLHEKTGLPTFEGIELPSVPDEWEISENELGVYSNGFKKLSGDKGYLTGSESKELLQRTQFSPPVLKKIWTLVGLDTSGSMNQEQFVVAMQLIAKIRAGVEAPEALPQSLDRILNKPKEPAVSPVKEEVKKIEVPKLKDPEAHTDVPKPQSKSTFGANCEENPKLLTSRSQVIEYEKHIKDQERSLKEKTNVLKIIVELLDIDEAELELIKEKNKILEGKLKECEEVYQKTQHKVSKAKEKLIKELTESTEISKKLKKENTALQEKLDSMKNQPPQKIPMQPVETKSALKPNAGFDMNSFFKDPLPSSSSYQTDGSKRESAYTTATTPAAESPISFSLPDKSELPRNEYKSESIPEPKEEKKVIDDKFPFKTGPTFFTQPETAFIASASVQKSSKTEPKYEEKVSKSESIPQFKMELKTSKFEDDIFAGLDKLKSEVKPPVQIKKPRSSSSSGSDDPKNKAQPNANFGFKFNAEIEKKVEMPTAFESKPDPFAPKPNNFDLKQNNFEVKPNAFDLKPGNFEFKPENVAFPAQFDGFNKGFAFPNSTPSFDSDFFKMDTQAIKAKGKSRELEFD